MKYIKDRTAYYAKISTILYVCALHNYYANETVIKSQLYARDLHKRFVYIFPM